MKAVPQPTATTIGEQLDRWQRLDNYQLQEQSLSRLFGTLCPGNTEIEDILLKVSALNDFYSTNIFDTYSVSRHIKSLDIDARLTAADLSLVNSVATVVIKNKTKNFYSFASKYCSHHRPTDYPIYDYFVEKMLLHYAKESAFSTFNKASLKDYATFVGVITAFREHYGLTAYTLRQIDIFLWLVGKDCFPKKYKKKHNKSLKEGAVPDAQPPRP